MVCPKAQISLIKLSILECDVPNKFNIKNMVYQKRSIQCISDCINQIPGNLKVLFEFPCFSNCLNNQTKNIIYIIRLQFKVLIEPLSTLSTQCLFLSLFKTFIKVVLILTTFLTFKNYSLKCIGYEYCIATLKSDQFSITISIF